MTSDVVIVRHLHKADKEEIPVQDLPVDGVNKLLQTLNSTVWAGRINVENTPWEKFLCEIIISMNPKIRIMDVIESIPHRSFSMDLVGLLNAMANLGYASKKIYIKACDVDHRLMPCLFIPSSQNNAPVILKEKSDSREDGRAIIFSQFDEGQEKTSRVSRKGTGYSWFRGLMERFHTTFGYILLTGFVLNMVALATPIFIMLVYDRVISSNADNILPMLAVGVSLAIIAEWGLRHIRSKSLSWLGGRMDNIVSNRIFEHLMNLAPAYIERASIPSQIARIKTFETIRDFFSGSNYLAVHKR